LADKSTLYLKKSQLPIALNIGKSVLKREITLEYPIFAPQKS